MNIIKKKWKKSLESGKIVRNIQNANKKRKNLREAFQIVNIYYL